MQFEELFEELRPGSYRARANIDWPHVLTVKQGDVISFGLSTQRLNPFTKLKNRPIRVDISEQDDGQIWIRVLSR